MSHKVEKQGRSHGKNPKIHDVWMDGLRVLGMDSTQHTSLGMPSRVRGRKFVGAARSLEGRKVEALDRVETR